MLKKKYFNWQLELTDEHKTIAYEEAIKG